MSVESAKNKSCSFLQLWFVDMVSRVESTVKGLTIISLMRIDAREDARRPADWLGDYQIKYQMIDLSSTNQLTTVWLNELNFDLSTYRLDDQPLGHWPSHTVGPTSWCTYALTIRCLTWLGGRLTSDLMAELKTYLQSYRNSIVWPLDGFPVMTTYWAHDSMSWRPDVLRVGLKSWLLIYWLHILKTHSSTYQESNYPTSFSASKQTN